MSWIGVITDAGAAILAQWDGGGHTLTIDGATVGSGITPEANLRAMTNLKTPEDTAQVIQVEEVTGGTRFKVQVLAADDAYIAHEVGIWAHLDSGTSTLIAVHQDSGTGVSVPDEDTSPDFAFALYCVHQISNTSQIQVTIDTSVFVTLATLNDYVTELSARLHSLERMVLQNDFYVPFATDDVDLTLFTTDDGEAIVADWHYQMEGE